ncbi:MAG TPA: alanine transaminase [Balneolales bacterium]|nr:alanine transaminase [Balneolales bacterium]
MNSHEFNRIKRLPPYAFAVTNEMKMKARRAGEDIVDMSMGNPDQPTPQPIVDKLVEAAGKPHNHRYSVSRGIYKLRLALTDWYKRHYDVDLDPESEAVVTMGSKEGLAHLVLGTIDQGDIVLCPDPTYPIHAYSVVIAGGDLRQVPLEQGDDFFVRLEEAYNQSWPRPKMLILNFPHNPTTEVVDLNFFQQVVDFALEHNLLVIHDLAYADLCFDGYKAPSLLQIPEARKIGVETFTLSKSYNMPGWRVGFCAGNKDLISALQRIKSYLDYGIFQPVQIAAIEALNNGDSYAREISDLYQNRRDVLIESLQRIGWEVKKPKATMFVWGRIPEHFREMGSLEFSKFLLKEAKVAVSPGIGFGHHGDEYVRFALIENDQRIHQAVRGMKKAFEIKV